MLCCLIDRKRQLKIGARVVGYLNRLLDYITRNSENESIVDDTERGDVELIFKALFIQYLIISKIC
jgi:hypothetical protein